MAKMMLKRVGVLSVAKWQTLIGVFSGIFIGIFYSYSYGQGQASRILYYLVSSPVIYGIVTFLSTVICGHIYNALAGTLGGMLLEFEEVATETPLPPSPPSFQ
jgi:hypothetical protein